jgi:mannose-1-phosphate guanylyltransferase
LTLALPKCLVPIGNEPLLAVWLDLCEAQGVTDVLLNVSQHVHLVERFLEQRTGGPSVTLLVEQAPRGTAGTVAHARGFVDDEEDFWVFYADNLTDLRLAPMLDAHRAHADVMTIGLFHAPDPRAAGIVDLDADGRILGFTEKPAVPTSDLANAGVYLARRALLDHLPTGRGLLDFGHDVLPGLAGLMRGYVIPDFLMDIGTPQALARATAAWRGRREGRHPS